MNRFTITNIDYKRAVFILEVPLIEGLSADDIALYELNSQKEYKPTIVKVQDNSAQIYINVESANNEMPLESGIYYVGSRFGHRAVFSEELLERRIDEKWKDEISIVKNRQEYLMGSTRRDKDGLFYLSISTVLPKYEQKHRTRRLAQGAFSLVFDIFNIWPKTGKRILFTSGSRKSLSGNEKFIYDKMVEMGLDGKYQMTFDFKESIKRRYGPYKMLRFIYRLARADVVICDDYYPEISKVKFSKKVSIFQVWHACGAFKTVGLERMAKKGAPAINTLVHKSYTHVPVSSELVAMHYQEAFGIDYSKMYPVGIPRTDIFFDKAYAETVKKAIYENYPQIEKARRVILYAPTFRGNSAVDAHFPMQFFDLKKMGEFCKKTDSYLIIKMHPFVKRQVVVPQEYRDYMLDVSSYREINDLLFVTDVLITDYSSVMYEYSLLGKPMLFYAFDLENYIKDRDFYEPYEKMIPGPLCRDLNSLIDMLEHEKYDMSRQEWFVNRNFTHQDGKSTERVVELIVDCLERK